MNRLLRRSALVLLLTGGVLAVGGYAYLQLPKFGVLPEGARLQAIERSPHYVNGTFQNLIDTPLRTEDSSLVANVLSMLFDRNERLRPDTSVPTVKRDLKALAPTQDVVVWLGHSSYFIQIGGRRILIDPVFSLEAAPAPHLNSAFAGSTPYSIDDMPEIDYLLITHDHWDHLDHPSVIALGDRTRHIVTGLGVGGFFEHWGYPRERIHEADWNSMLELDEGLRIHLLPARHYSGRMLMRNKTLWVAFALETPKRRLFFSGDSGYGPHFREIGERFGGFDLVALDTGQYDKRWPYIHMFPEEAALAAEDLHAEALLPAHVGRFSIAAHDWDEPLDQLEQLSQGKPYRLLTPRIGDLVFLDEPAQRFDSWWESLRR
jgi:L-ascorbate metabolism protein UlaG (beta-lactamase superfamily)